MSDAANSQPEFSWQFVENRIGYTLYQSGSHIRGDFVQVYVPDHPYVENEKRKVITYLHGFALCLPKFYLRHLEKLAANGYYVIFPDFQNSDYPDEVNQSKLVPSKDKRHLYFWYQMVIDTITQQRESSADKFDKQKRKAEEFHRIRRNDDDSEPSVLECFLVALALVIIILSVRLIYLFRPTRSRNLVKLVSTVGLSLLYHPSVWMHRSIDLTKLSWERLCKNDLKLTEAEFDFYVFGHSLGGLLALSWNAYVIDSRFRPTQVITADPAPSTELGIPSLAILILKLFRSPFTREPITIRETGSKLNLPVGILHGADDTLVKPEIWVKRASGAQKSNFEYIESTRKAIYFSLSEKQHYPPLIAFHNQAVTDTTYFDDTLFENFGGVKHEPNAYNNDYVWAGLQFVVKSQHNANDLLPYFPRKTIQVVGTLPPQSPSFSWTVVLVVLALLGIAYWIWRFGIAIV